MESIQQWFSTHFIQLLLFFFYYHITIPFFLSFIGQEIEFKASDIELYSFTIESQLAIFILYQPGFVYVLVGFRLSKELSFMDFPSSKCFFSTAGQIRPQHAWLQTTAAHSSSSNLEREETRSHLERFIHIQTHWLKSVSGRIYFW